MFGKRNQIESSEVEKLIAKEFVKFTPAVKRFCVKEIEEVVADKVFEWVSSEEFIDNIVERILKKQLK